MDKTPTSQFTSPTPKPYPSKTLHCTTCEMEIRGRPTFWIGLAFCCAGCAVSGPCTCSYDFDIEDLVTAPAEEEARPEPVLAGR